MCRFKKKLTIIIFCTIINKDTFKIICSKIQDGNMDNNSMIW